MPIPGSNPTLADFANLPHWVAWQTEDRADGKPTKVPYSPNGPKARADNPKTWGTRAAAEARAARLALPYGQGGIGIEFGELGDGISLGGVDLDSCCTPGAPLAPWAQCVVDLLASYAETSPSGTGCKVFFTYRTEHLAVLRDRGLIDPGDGDKRKPGWGKQWKQGGGDHPPAIELHLGNRYFTTTNQSLPQSPLTLRLVSLEDLEALFSIGAEFKGAAEEAKAGRSKAKAASNDQSRSAIAFRKGAALRRSGKTYDQMVEALRADPETEDWCREKGEANGQRELKRIWERAGESADELITEDSIALAFAAAHKDDLRYDHNAGAWFQWNGAIWRREMTKLAFNWAREMARDEAAKADNFKARLSAGKASFASGVERLAQADRHFAVTNEIWNQDLYLLGTPDGTVDLRTGALRPSQQTDYITKQTAVGPADEAICPTWLEFLAQATQRDETIVSFLKRWFGYCLTGDVSEQALLFAWGVGGNGKGVLMNTVSAIFGDYAATAAMDAFVAGRGDKHSTDLAMLAGARLVTTTEVDEGQTWAEAKIKTLTGGDPVTARFMRRDNFTYLPQFKLTVSGNHKPRLNTVDDAIRRRMNLAAFLYKPAKPDKTLPERLKREYPGILRWLIDGCIEWQQFGLVPPKAIVDATASYFEAQDFYGRWLQECCEIYPNLETPPGLLLRSFQAWCNANGEAFTDNKWLRSRLESTPGVRYVTTQGKQKVRGIGFKAKPDCRQPRDE